MSEGITEMPNPDPFYQPTKLKEVYDIEIETLSPLQVGSGAKLIRDVDYFESNGNVQQINVVDVEQLLSDEIIAEAFFSGNREFGITA